MELIDRPLGYIGPNPNPKGSIPPKRVRQRWNFSPLDRTDDQTRGKDSLATLSRAV
jgi:hypothetical protein